MLRSDRLNASILSQKRCIKRVMTAFAGHVWRQVLGLIIRTNLSSPSSSGYSTLCGLGMVLKRSVPRHFQESSTHSFLDSRIFPVTGNQCFGPVGVKAISWLPLVDPNRHSESSEPETRPRLRRCIGECAQYPHGHGMVHLRYSARDATQAERSIHQQYQQPRARKGIWKTLTYVVQRPPDWVESINMTPAMRHLLPFRHRPSIILGMDSIGRFLI